MGLLRRFVRAAAAQSEEYHRFQIDGAGRRRHVRLVVALGAGQEAWQPAPDGAGDAWEVGLEAVVAAHRDHPPRRAGCGHAEAVSLALHHQRRNAHRVELWLTRRRCGRALAPWRDQREREAHDTDRAGSVGGPAGDPGAGGSAAGDQRQFAQGAAEQLLDDRTPREVELLGTRGRAPPGDPVGLLDSSDDDARLPRRPGHGEQIAGRHRSAGAVPKHHRRHRILDGVYVRPSDALRRLDLEHHHAGRAARCRAPHARGRYGRTRFAAADDMRHPLPMDAAFRGFGTEVFEWFAGLERDNSKAYFTATRDRYENDVRGGLEAMLDELSESFGGHARMYRQQRDLRFTPDKSPYKTTTYGILRGAPGGGAGLYAQLSAHGLYAGTGYYLLARDQLERFRDAVASERTGARLVEAAAAAEDAGLELAGGSLKTAPRGYPRDHPRIELLRRKWLIAGRALAGAGGIGRNAAIEHVSTAWRVAAPLNAWLDAHVGPSASAAR